MLVDAAAGVLINLVMLGCVGLGPTLLLFARRLDAVRVVAIAPSVGFALASLFATWLVTADLPVRTWWAGWLLGGVCISALLAFRSPRWGAAWVRPSGVGLYGGVLVAAAALLIAPMLVGGLRFTVLRGNGTDSFNYLIMAAYLDRQPLSLAFNSSPQQLAAMNPLYPLARALLAERWATSALLAVTAHVANVSLVRWDYGFSLLSMLLVFGGVFATGREIDLSERMAALVALAATVGFWGQYIVDVRAIAQENGTVLAVLVAFLAARLRRAAIGESVALGLALASLAVVYAEMLPTALLGLLTAMLFGARFQVIRLARVALGAALVLTLPSWTDLLRYAQVQTGKATLGQNNWQDAYFRWLYDDPWKGVWGLGSIAFDSRVAAWFGFDQGRWSQLLTFAGGALSLALIAGAAVQLVRARNACSSGTLVGFPLASALEALLLGARSQLWAAGKAVSFGYPFGMLVLAGVWLSGPRKGLGGVLARGVLVWLLIQVGLGGYRVWLTLNGAEPPEYIEFHGSYAKHGWNIAPLQAAIDHAGCESLWTAVDDAWATQYLDLALGDACRPVDVYGVRTGAPGGPTFQSFDAPPTFLLVDRSRWLNADALEQRLVAQNADFALVRPGEQPVLLDAMQPAGVDPTGATRAYVRWAR